MDRLVNQKAVLITARMGSSRYPGKMLTPLGTSSLLEQCIRRAQFIAPGVQCIVTTTSESTDDTIEEKSRSLGALVFRGSPEDVLRRHRDACDVYGVESYLSLDGDDPFVDERAARVCLSAIDSCDYVKSSGLPIGMNAIGVRRTCLDRILARMPEGNTEGWGRFFTDPEMGFRRITVAFEPEISLYGFARLTMDYNEDMDFAQAVFSRFPRAYELRGEELIRVLREDEGLRRINLGRNEEYRKRFESLYGG